MRDEHDVDRPVEHATKFVTDPSGSLLLRWPPFRWHPQATFAVAFDQITEHDDGPARESEDGFAPTSLGVLEDRDVDPFLSEAESEPESQRRRRRY
jgi:hypothetical protein